MNRTSAIVFAALVGTVPMTAHAQVRRSAGPDGGPPAGGAGVPRGIPRSEKHPYAGVFSGSFSLRADREIPVVMVFNVADSAKGVYSGATIMPDNGRVPHLETAVSKGEMKWKQQNSGGGFWVYTGHFVSRDSIAGTVVLTDWPQLPAGEKPPSGTFSIVRRPPGA